MFPRSNAPNPNASNPLLSVQLSNQTNKKNAEISTVGLTSRAHSLATFLINESKNKNKQNGLNAAIKQTHQFKQKITNELVPLIDGFSKNFKSVHANQTNQSGRLVNKAGMKANFKMADFQRNFAKLANDFNKNENKWLNLLSSQTDRTAFKQIFTALNTYEDFIQDITYVQVSCNTIYTFSNSMVANLEQKLLLCKGQEETETNTLLIQNYKQLGTRAFTIIHQVNQLQTNGVPTLQLLESAIQKHSSICNQLADLKLDNSGIILAIAERHKVSDAFKYLISQTEQLQQDYSRLDRQGAAYINNQGKSESADKATDLSWVDKPTKQAQQSEQTANTRAMQNKQAPKAVPTNETKTPAATADATQQTNAAISTSEIKISILKRLDWVTNDLNEYLSAKTSEAQQQTAEHLLDRLKIIESNTNEQWPSETKQIAKQQSTLETELLALEAEFNTLVLSSARPSSPLSSGVIKLPQQDKTAAPVTAATQTQESPTKQKQTPSQPIIASTKKNLNQVTKKIIHSTTQSQPIVQPSKHTVVPLSVVLNRTADLIAKTGQRIDHLSSLQQSLQSDLLKQATYNPLWSNVYEAQTLINFLRATLQESQHQVFVIPYFEALQPATEMLRIIQLNKTHPHFDEANVRDFLAYIPHWVADFEPYFQRLEVLLNAHPINK